LKGEGKPPLPRSATWRTRAVVGRLDPASTPRIGGQGRRSQAWRVTAGSERPHRHEPSPEGMGGCAAGHARLTPCRWERRRGLPRERDREWREGERVREWRDGEGEALRAPLSGRKGEGGVGGD